MGKPAARLGDLHTCPMVDGPKPHVGGPVLEGSLRVLIGGQPAAVMGGKCLCVSPAPDVIVQGSLMVLIGGCPAARMGDLTAHGGTIVSGCPLVLIGDVVPYINAQPNLSAGKAGQVASTTSGYAVPVKDTGFPDFSFAAQRTVKIHGMQGNAEDYIKANAAAFPVESSGSSLSDNQKKWIHKWALGYSPQDAGLTTNDKAYWVWHHHEDGETMQLVPSDLNNPGSTKDGNGGLPHTGGSAVSKHNRNFPAHQLALPSPS